MMPAPRHARARVYDALVAGMTASWYGAVLHRLAPACGLLDVGIGTGAALLANAATLRERGIRVVGLDVDADYVARCTERVRQAGLADRIEARLESVYDHRGGPYDAAYFSGSFMLLPDPVAALRHVAALVRGPIYFTQTFEHERSALLETLKPLLKLVTTVDFGRVTYEADFRSVLDAAGMDVTDRVVLRAGRRRSSLLVVARSQLRPRG